ncbi:hypothetical protein CSB20_06155 [bacterium DOLZORAL124_64_63]|nr:MAG: hypothetical protein CSB20_06155 [bacterium DOLZORAL124_64_63]
MKWLDKRFLYLSYAIVLVGLALVGCTSKEDPSEVLPLCGNHTCGHLAMVTTDTASDGFHYLDPRMSPDGTRIIFTADWKAIPAERTYDENELYVSYRQLIVIPRRESVDPAFNLSDQGGVLVRFDGNFSSLWINNASVSLSDIESERRKADPDWLDDSNIIFSLYTPRGYRLFSADITGICNNEDCKVVPTVAYMEPDDNTVSGGLWQHLGATVSPDGNWVAFIRSGCALPDSFETCTGTSLMLMETASMAQNNGYDCRVLPLTNEYSYIEGPTWSPDGTRLAFSGGMDVGGLTGAGTELYTIDFDTTGFSAGAMALDNNLTRLTYTSYADGDPIAGVLNSSPSYTPGGDQIVFVSTRRAPSITLHDRNLWMIPSDGRLDPELFFFTRSDDVDPEVLLDGSVLLSSQLGYPTEIMDQLEEEAYQRLLQDNEQNGLTEVEMRAAAAEARKQLEYFEGVMSHLYIFTP